MARKPSNASDAKAAMKTSGGTARTGAERAAKASPKATAPARAKTSPAQPPAPRKAQREEAPKRPQKERLQLEFMVRSAPTVLYDLVSTPSGFSEWYCSDVNTKGDLYTFIWPGEEETALMIGRRTGEVIRFRRADEDDPNAYFEFRIRIDAMTNEVALIVTDHAWPHEVEETRNLWASQVANLIRVLGA
jgi:hypothetical protein